MNSPDAPHRRLLDHWNPDPADAAGLMVIAGPCVLESDDLNLRIAETIATACAEVGATYVFKASFDKANRSSIHSDRGPGLRRGLEQLAEIRSRLDVPILTDVHEPDQATRVAEVVDLLQIPAFLCRQTDLLAACGGTGRPVAVKKGQFMSPAEMRLVLEKLRESGAGPLMVTERGTFFGYHRLVNDFIGLGDLMEIANDFDALTCFDATHSTQLPGGSGSMSGGRPERAPLLARAAVAAGVRAVFLEAHPDPAAARSDAATVLPLDAVPELLSTLARLQAVVDGVESRT